MFHFSDSYFSPAFYTVMTVDHLTTSRGLWRYRDECGSGYWWIIYFLISTFSHISEVQGAVFMNAGPRRDIFVSASDSRSAARQSGGRPCERLKPNKTVHKLTTLWINKTKSVSLAVYFYMFYFQTSCFALSFSMDHGGLFAIYLEEVAWKVYCGETWKEAKLHFISLTRFLNWTGWKRPKRTSHWSTAINLVI